MKQYVQVIQGLTRVINSGLSFQSLFVLDIAFV